MNYSMNLDTKVEKTGFNNTDLLDLTSREAHMRDALKSYQQFIADKPSIAQLTADARSSGVSDPNIVQKDIEMALFEWNARGVTAGQALEEQAKSLQTKLMKSVGEGDRDKEIADMNIDGLQKLINKLNDERDQIAASVDELNTARGVDSHVKVEYKAQYMHYITLLCIILVLFGVLSRIQASQESGAMEMVVLVAAVAFMVYYFSGWAITATQDTWDWLNRVFRF